MSLLILAMSSVSASDVSDISDNQEIISDQDSISEDIVSESLDLSSADLESTEDADSVSDIESDDSKLGSSEMESDPLSEDETTKDSTSIEASSSSVVYGNDYSVTLKDKNGNVLSGKNLIFTFNGNNYTRTTDSNGVASIKINAAAGTYLIRAVCRHDLLLNSRPNACTFF